MAGVFHLYGIRGNAARKNISLMEKGEMALWYSSSAGKKVYGTSDICRLFYFYYREKIYVVTSGYKKKENKTKKTEIDKAISIMNNFLEQQNEET